MMMMMMTTTMTMMMSLVSVSSMACLHQLHFNFSGMTAPVNE
jgi:hypothetical protein